MEFTAKQIAEFIGGRVEGNENAAVHTFAKIEEGQPGAISFLSNPKYTHYLYETASSIVLVNDDLELEQEVKATLIRVKNAYEAVAKLLQLYESMKPKKTGIDPLAFVKLKAAHLRHSEFLPRSVTLVQLALRHRHYREQQHQYDNQSFHYSISISAAKEAH